MKLEKIFAMPFASVYPAYINKAERKGRTKQEVNEIIYWLTGYSATQLQQLLEEKRNFKDFFDQAPILNPNVVLIKGVICGYKIEDIENPLMKKIRYLDKLIDELAKGKSMEKILRNH